MQGDARAQKISATMRAKGLDNFAAWRERTRWEGRFGRPEVPLGRTEDLAEFIGLVLGDGNISVFPRTERLIIACDAKKVRMIRWYADLTQRLFGKNPTISKMKASNCIRISIYQRGIAERLGIPSGNRSRIFWKLPTWIKKNSNNLCHFLRGLYEAEGSYSVHTPTYTHKFLFANINISLLDIVFTSLQQLGFHPHRSRDKIQLSRKSEIDACMKLLKFRKYDMI